MKSISHLDPALNDQGLTLVELVVVVGVIVVLVAALGFEFQDWVARYKIESETKDLYTKLVNLKAEAMNTGRSHFIWVWPANLRKYRFYEDTYPPPGGDGSCVRSQDSIMSDEECEYDMLTNSPTDVFGFNSKGILVESGGAPSATIFYIRFNHTKEPDYDCVEFNRTRINLGLFENGKCETR